METTFPSSSQPEMDTCDAGQRVPGRKEVLAGVGRERSARDDAWAGFPRQRGRSLTSAPYAADMAGRSATRPAKVLSITVA